MKSQELEVRNSQPILIYVVPGLVMVIGISLFFPELLNSINTVTLSYLPVIFTLATILSLILGILLRSERAPGSFIIAIDAIDDETVENAEKGRIGSTIDWIVECIISIRGVSPSLSEEIQEDILDSLKGEFGLSEDYSDYNELYRLLRAKLDGTLSSQAIRLETMYLFSQHLALAIGWLSIIYIITGVLELMNFTSIYAQNFWPVILIVLSLFFGFPILFILLGIKDSYQRAFAEQLLLEFYLTQIEDKSMSRGQLSLQKFT